MFYIKSKSKRKNVITSLVVVLLMAGSILLDNSIAPPQQNQPDKLSYSGNVQQAGWFWGWHKNKKTMSCEYRVFGFRWLGSEECCK